MPSLSRTTPHVLHLPLAVFGAILGAWAVVFGFLLPFFWPPSIRWLLHSPVSIGFPLFGISVLTSAILSPFLLILGLQPIAPTLHARLYTLFRKTLAIELLLGSFLWLLSDIVRLFQADPALQMMLTRKLILMDPAFIRTFPGLFLAPLSLSLGYGLLTHDHLRDQIGLFLTTLAYESLVLLAIFGHILQGAADQAGLIAQAITQKAILGLHSDIAQPLAKLLQSLFPSLTASALSKHIAGLIVALYIALPSGALLWSWSKQRRLSARSVALLFLSPFLLVLLLDRASALASPLAANLLLSATAALLSVPLLLTLVSALLPLYALLGLSLRQPKPSYPQVAVIWLLFGFSFFLLRLFVFYSNTLPAGQNLHKITLLLALIVPIAGIAGVWCMQPELRLRVQLLFSAPLWVPFFFLFFLWSLILNTTLYFLSDLSKRTLQPPRWMRIFPLSVLSLLLFPLLLVLDFVVGMMRQLGENALDALYPREERITSEGESTQAPALSVAYVLGALLLLSLPLWGLPALLYLAVRLFVYEAIILQLLGGSDENDDPQASDTSK
ncbi:hypothetical protein L6R29_00395 [Myxococcota bacterium]|nr:hypothetical protein [Myxococcota bacterium]